MNRLIIATLAVTGFCLIPLIPSTKAQDITSPDPIVTPKAKVQTANIEHEADSADDPAIWICPSDATKSLILGTDKRGGIDTYSLDGAHRQTVSSDSHPDNVDVLYGVPLDGATVDLAIAACRAPGHLGVKIWKIDSAGTLTDITQGDVIPAFGGTEPYGSCVYHSPRDGAFYYFVNNKQGQIAQYRIKEAGGGKMTGIKVREMKLGTQVEGCVADDELRFLYVAEEDVGIWKFDAEPDGSTTGKMIAKVGEHGLKDDVEGLTLYNQPQGKGYLIASSQGNSTFKVYTREGENRFVETIDPVAGEIDDVSDTDGVAACSTPLGDKFPAGIFVVQDGETPSGFQNFKIFDWRDIAPAKAASADTTPGQ